MARVMPPKGEMSALVQRIVNDARRKSAKDAELAARMAPLLGGFVYGNSSISSWGTGRDRPTAEALLAAVKVSGIHLDEYLYGEEYEDRQNRLERELGELRRLIQERADEPKP